MDHRKGIFIITTMLVLLSAHTQAQSFRNRLSTSESTDSEKTAVPPSPFFHFNQFNSPVANVVTPFQILDDKKIDDKLDRNDTTSYDGSINTDNPEKAGDENESIKE